MGVLAQSEAANISAEVSIRTSIMDLGSLYTVRL